MINARPPARQTPCPRAAIRVSRRALRSPRFAHHKRRSMCSIESAISVVSETTNLRSLAGQSPAVVGVRPPPYEALCSAQAPNQAPNLGDPCRRGNSGGHSASRRDVVVRLIRIITHSEPWTDRAPVIRHKSPDGQLRPSLIPWFGRRDRKPCALGALN